MNFQNIILFSIMLNLATGLILIAIPAFDELPEYRGGLPDYNITYSDKYIASLDTDPSGEDDANPKNQLQSRVETFIFGIGNIFKLIGSSFGYGFIKLLEFVFGSMMTPTLSNFVFTYTLKPLMLMFNAYGIFYLITGKKLLGE